jgi:glutathione S-transferase
MSMKLHVVAGSHPCACVEAALRIKGVEYRRVELPVLVHRVAQRLRYGKPTVPGLSLEDGEKVVGSVVILRRLEELVPEPPLYPGDAAGRERVEASEAWGEAVLQEVVRRIDTALWRRHPSAFVSYADASTLPIPRWLIRANAPLGVRLYARLVGGSNEAARADLRALPGHLDHIDDLIAKGVIGGAAANAGDLQIGASVRQLGVIADLAPLLAGRPASALTRHFPPMVGHIPAGTAPPDWLETSAPPHATGT